MKTRKNFLLITLLFCFSIVFSQKANYFIELNDSTITIGEYNEKLNRIAHYEAALVDLDFSKVNQYLLSDSTENILFYFHAMWGGQKMFNKSSIKKFQQIDSLDKVIAFIWHTDHVFYKPSWEKSIEQGIRIQNLFIRLISEHNNNHVLCHSMGNRIFEGIMSRAFEKHIKFETVFLVASDLDVDIFSKNLKTLPNISDKVFIYCNKKDLALRASRMIHKRDRLGLQAMEYLDEYHPLPNVQVIDVSTLKGCSPSRHVYYKKHPNVFNHIASNINTANKEIEFSDKKNNGYILLK